MTWTYNPATLATSLLYQTRLLLGDTDSTDPLLADEELTYLLTVAPAPALAAAEAAGTLAARFAREADQSVGRLSESRSQRARAFEALAVRLRGQAARGLTSAVAPYLGGASIVDKNVDRADTDRVEPFFSRDQFDIDGGSQDTREREPT